jgi:aspartate dehydrogenase
MISIGIVGCGTIGSAIARAIQEGRVRATLAGLTGRTSSRAEALARSLTPSPPVLCLPELIAVSDLVAEAASVAAVAEIVPACLEAGKDVFVISAAGLLGHDDWFRRAEAQGVRIVVPSGAIAGLDGLRAATLGRVDSVLLVTRRPPETLSGAPYVVERGIELDGLTQETVIFEGTAREACRGFPRHVNVPAALSLAGVGLDRTRVRVLAAPGCKFNQHQIEVLGEFGRLRVEIENTPSSMNPRTGLLSIFTSIETLAEYARSRR